MPVGAAPTGAGVGELDSSVRLPAVDGEAADRVGSWVDDPKGAAVGGQACVLGADRGSVQRRALEQAERAVGRDRVARDRLGARVDSEEVLAVVADLDRAGAVWLSGNGEAPIGVRMPSALTVKAETVPALVPLWALAT